MKFYKGNYYADSKQEYNKAVRNLYEVLQSQAVPKYFSSVQFDDYSESDGKFYIKCYVDKKIGMTLQIPVYASSGYRYYFFLGDETITLSPSSAYSNIGAEVIVMDNAILLVNRDAGSIISYSDGIVICKSEEAKTIVMHKGTPTLLSTVGPAPGTSSGSVPIGSGTIIHVLGEPPIANDSYSIPVSPFGNNRGAIVGATVGTMHGYAPQGVYVNVQRGLHGSEAPILYTIKDKTYASILRNTFSVETT